MKIEKFEDIIAWQKAEVLTLGIYADFRNCKDYSFRDQIQRATISIMNNIAEGFERRTNKELKNFLFIAKGSCGEVRSMLNLALKLEYLTKDKHDKYCLVAIEISKMLSGFIKTI